MSYTKGQPPPSPQPLVGALPWPLGIKLPEEGVWGYTWLCKHVSFYKENKCCSEPPVQTPGY